MNPRFPKHRILTESGLLITLRCRLLLILAFLCCWPGVGDSAVGAARLHPGMYPGARALDQRDHGLVAIEQIQPGMWNHRMTCLLAGKATAGRIDTYDEQGAEFNATKRMYHNGRTMYSGADAYSVGGLQLE